MPAMVAVTMRRPTSEGAGWCCHQPISVQEAVDGHGFCDLSSRLCSGSAAHRYHGGCQAGHMFAPFKAVDAVV
jgi:hypothetical protein